MHEVARDRCVYMIVHGIGRQQHSYPSHSIHFVFPGCVPAGLVIEEVIELLLVLGKTSFLGLIACEADVHIVADFKTLETGLLEADRPKGILREKGEHSPTYTNVEVVEVMTLGWRGIGCFRAGMIGRRGTKIGTCAAIKVVLSA